MIHQDQQNEDGQGAPTGDQHAAKISVVQLLPFSDVLTYRPGRGARLARTAPKQPTVLMELCQTTIDSRCSLVPKPF